MPMLSYRSGRPEATRQAALLIGLCLSVYLSGARAFPPEKSVQFSGYANSQGLSHNSVTCLLQDQKGLLWIGTQGGLSCYDGYRFRNFHHHPADPGSPSSESIYSLYQDRRGRIWVGTTTSLEFWQDFHRVRLLTADGVTAISEDPSGGIWFAGWGGGLLYLAPGADTLSRVHPPDRPGIPPFQQILSLLADRQGRIWMGLFKQGLYRYTPASGGVEKIILPSTLPDGATDHVYHTILQDDRERIWVASLQGLYCLSDGHWIHYRHDPGEPNSLANDNILALCMADSQQLWIGTDGSGLDRLDIRSGQFHHYPPRDKKSGLFPAGKVTALLHDRTGLLWAGTQGAGLIKIVTGRTVITHSSGLLAGLGEWVNAPVWCFHEDSSGAVWIGGQTGLHRLDPTRNRATTEAVPTAILKDLPIRGIWVQNENTLFLGSQGRGLWQWQRDTGQMKHYSYQHLHIPSINSEVIYDLLADEAGSVWLACNTGGLFRFDLASEVMERILLPGFTNEQSCWVTDLLLTGDQLWFTTWSEGLYVLNVKSRKPRKIGWLRPEDLDQVYPLLSLRGSTSPILWAGSFGGGFYRLDLRDSTSTRCLAPAGMTDNVVFAIEQDRLGHLWYSSNQGLIQYNAQHAHFTLPDLPGGLVNREFNLGASLHSRNG